MARPSEYDPDNLNRLRLDDQALDALRGELVQEALNPLLDWIGDKAREMLVEREIPFEIGFLYLTRLVQEATESAVYWRAAEARAAGVPKVGVADVMGWRGGSTVQKKWPDLDRIIEVREAVDSTGKPQNIDFGQGFTITIQPGETAS